MKLALFVCNECGAVTALSPNDPAIVVDEDSVTVDDDGVEVLSRCAIVRETCHDDHDVCNGDLGFAGVVTLGQLRFARSAPPPTEGLHA